MEVKEIIKWLNNFKVCLDDVVYCDDGKKLSFKELQDVISSLQELEKYKDMWEEIEGFFKPGKAIEIPIEAENADYLCKEIQTLNYIINDLKQKYFPQPVKKVITIEVEANSKNQMDWVTSHLKTYIEHEIKRGGTFNQSIEGDIKVNIKEVKE